MRAILLIPTVLAIGACSSEPGQPGAAPSTAATGDYPKPVLPDPAVPPPDHVGPEPSATPFAPEIATILLTREEWKKAENRKDCAPLAFRQTGENQGQPRRANFSGGWAVAYDTPSVRSAFGIGGPSIIPADAPGVAEQRARLARQWPNFRELSQLPKPAFAGYGVEGAQDYSDANPEGKGQNSVAYLRIGGQRCTYNVWSRLGRAHLEFLLENLVTIDPN